MAAGEWVARRQDDNEWLLTNRQPSQVVALWSQTDSQLYLALANGLFQGLASLFTQLEFHLGKASPKLGQHDRYMIGTA